MTDACDDHDQPGPPEIDHRVRFLLESLTDRQSARQASNTRLGRHLAYQSQLRAQTQRTFAALEHLGDTLFAGPDVTLAWRTVADAMRTLNRLRARRPRHLDPGCDPAAAMADQIKARYVAWGCRELLRLATQSCANGGDGLPQGQLPDDATAATVTASATADRQLLFLREVLAGRYG
jgi:hypothetical protein